MNASGLRITAAEAFVIGAESVTSCSVALRRRPSRGRGTATRACSTSARLTSISDMRCSLSSRLSVGARHRTLCRTAEGSATHARHHDRRTPTLHVEVEGDGPPVTVFAHGLTNSRNELAAFTPFLAGTKVRFDFRGHGLSSVPETGYRFADFARDLDAVAAAYGATRAVGTSLGRRRDHQPHRARARPVRTDRLPAPRGPGRAARGSSRLRPHRRAPGDALEGAGDRGDPVVARPGRSSTSARPGCASSTRCCGRT